MRQSVSGEACPCCVESYLTTWSPLSWWASPVKGTILTFFFFMLWITGRLLNNDLKKKQKKSFSQIMQKLVKKYFKIPYYRHCRINNYIFYLSVGLIPLLPLSTLHHRPQKTHKLSENCEFSVCISALFLYSFKCVLSFIICSWLHILSFHSFSAHSSGFKTVSTLCS